MSALALTAEHRHAAGIDGRAEVSALILPRHPEEEETFRGEARAARPLPLAAAPARRYRPAAWVGLASRASYLLLRTPEYDAQASRPGDRYRYTVNTIHDLSIADCAS